MLDSAGTVFFRTFGLLRFLPGRAACLDRAFSRYLQQTPAPAKRLSMLLLTILCFETLPALVQVEFRFLGLFSNPVVRLFAIIQRKCSRFV